LEKAKYSNIGGIASAVGQSIGGIANAIGGTLQSKEQTKQSKEGTKQAEVGLKGQRIDLAKDISDLSGLDLEITGGNDKFHTKLSYNSAHKTGDAIDVVPTAGMNNVNDKKFEEAVISIMSSRKYGNRIGFINERLNPSGAASGPHFHLSLTNNTKYSWFGFIDKDGNPRNPSSSHLTWGDGGKYPVITKKYHNAVEKDVKPVMKTDYQQYKLNKNKNNYVTNHSSSIRFIILTN
jgi:hypothetical protein